MKRTIYSINGRRALRRARKISEYKRRKENELKYKQFYKKEKEPFFDTTEDFFNFLFGTIISLTILIIIFPIFKDETIDIRDVINNGFNRTNRMERVINSNVLHPTEFEKRQQEKFKEHTAY